MQGSTHHGAGRLVALLVGALTAVILLSGAPAVGAAAATPGPTGTNGVTGGATAGGVASTGVNQTLAPIDVHGGYVAAGTGMRNRGYGSIHLTGVPHGATVVRAYLYWTVTGTSATPGASFPNGK